jgi:hypothetical protein
MKFLLLFAAVKKMKEHKYTVFDFFVSLLPLSVSVFCIILLGWDCEPEEQCYYNSYSNVTSYNFVEDARTSKGISVMRGKNNSVSLEEIDLRVDELEACLRAKGRQVTVKRSCLKVLIPNNWYTSECTGSQMFSCRINPQVCLDKGITEEELAVCPCACRAIIQDENIIVSAPNLQLFKAELARMVTGINNVWTTNFTECL